MAKRLDAGWIKMKLGTEVGLGPGRIVLDGDQFPSPKEAQPPIFGRCLLWQNGWMDQDETWYERRPRFRPYCVRWEPSWLPKGQGSPPLFGSCLFWPYGRPSQLVLNTCLYSFSAIFFVLVLPTKCNHFSSCFSFGY